MSPHRLLRLLVLALALAATAAPWPSAERTLVPLRGLTWNRDHAGVTGRLPLLPLPTLEVSRSHRPAAARGGETIVQPSSPGVPRAALAFARVPYAVWTPVHLAFLAPHHATTIPPPHLS